MDFWQAQVKTNAELQPEGLYITHLFRLEEGGIEVRLDSHLVTVELRKHQRGKMPPYSHFVSELPRKLLKNFPVMLQFDKRRRFTGLVIFKPNPQARFANRKERKDRKEGNSSRKEFPPVR